MENDSMFTTSQAKSTIVYITGHGREADTENIQLPPNVTIKWYGAPKQTLSKGYNERVLRGEVTPISESRGEKIIPEHYISVSLPVEVSDRAFSFTQGDPYKQGAKLVTHTNVVDGSLPLSGIITLLVNKYPPDTQFVLHWAACRSLTNAASTEQVDVDGSIKSIPVDKQSLTPLTIFIEVKGKTPRFEECVCIGDIQKPTTIPQFPPREGGGKSIDYGNVPTSHSRDFSIPVIPEIASTSIRVSDDPIDIDIRGKLMKFGYKSFQACAKKIDQYVATIVGNDEKGQFKIALLEELKKISSKTKFDTAFETAKTKIQPVQSVPQQQLLSQPLATAATVLSSPPSLSGSAEYHLASIVGYGLGTGWSRDEVIERQQVRHEANQPPLGGNSDDAMGSPTASTSSSSTGDMLGSSTQKTSGEKQQYPSGSGVSPQQQQLQQHSALSDNESRVLGFICDHVVGSQREREKAKQIIRDALDKIGGDNKRQEFLAELHTKVTTKVDPDFPIPSTRLDDLNRHIAEASEQMSHRPEQEREGDQEEEQQADAETYRSPGMRM